MHRGHRRARTKFFTIIGLIILFHKIVNPEAANAQVIRVGVGGNLTGQDEYESNNINGGTLDFDAASEVNLNSIASQME